MHTDAVYRPSTSLKCWSSIAIWWGEVAKIQQGTCKVVDPTGIRQAAVGYGSSRH